VAAPQSERRATKQQRQLFAEPASTPTRLSEQDLFDHDLRRYGAAQNAATNAINATRRVGELAKQAPGVAVSDAAVAFEAIASYDDPIDVLATDKCIRALLTALVAFFDLAIAQFGTSIDPVEIPSWAHQCQVRRRSCILPSAHRGRTSTTWR
jgi:hypothetical protein